MQIRRMIQVSAERQLRLIVLLSALIAPALLPLGCAHEQAYKRGTKLSQEGQYERAVEELETAIRLAQQNNNDKAVKRYREMLEQVKQQAGQFYYREAEIAFGRADLGAAQRLIELCVTHCPQEQTYWAFRQRVHQAIAHAEQLRTEALALSDQQQWHAATHRMSEALSLYKTMPGGEADLKRIKDRAYRYHVDRAREELGRSDLDQAEAQAQAALAYQEAGKEAKDVLKTVAEWREAAGWITRGRTLLEQGDPEEALRALERAHQLHATHADLPGLLGKARRATCDRWLQQGRQAMQAHDHTAALRLFRRSAELLPGYGDVDALLSDAQSRLAETHVGYSRQHLENGTAGTAVLHAALAVGYRPDDLEARRQLGQCSEQVRLEVRYTIAFAGFRSASRDEYRPLASVLAAAAMEHLARTHPTNVVVVDRVDLQPDFEERGLSVVGPIASPSRSPIDTLHDTDALLMGQVLERNIVTEARRTGHGESTYQDGYRTEPNPDHVRAAAEFDEALKRLEQARVQLAEAEARLARYRHIDPGNADQVARKRRAQADADEAKRRLVNAAADVGAAELRVAAIPPEVLVPNMVKHQYPIETIRKTAKITCMLKMLDTASGEIIVAERIEGTHTQSDRVVSADPYRNVPEDPLELAGDSTLLDAAAEAVIAKLKAALSRACEKHGYRFEVRMRQAEAAGDTITSVDSAVKYLFAYPVGHDRTGDMVDRLRRYIGQEDGLVDLRALLRTHCQVLLARQS